MEIIKKTFIISILAVILIFAIIAGWFVLKNPSGDSLKEVPKLIGLSSEAANEKIEAVELTPHIKKVPVLDPSDIDRVVAQDPPENSSISKGDTVTIKIGIEGTKVPKVIGLSLEEAQESIKNAKLNLETKEEEKLAEVTIPSKVIKQYPSPDMVTAVNKTITLYVSPELSISKLIDDSLKQLNKIIEKQKKEVSSSKGEIATLKGLGFSWFIMIGILAVVVVGTVIITWLLIRRKYSKQIFDEKRLETLEQFLEKHRHGVVDLERLTKEINEMDRLISSFSDKQSILTDLRKLSEPPPSPTDQKPLVVGSFIEKIEELKEQIVLLRKEQSGLNNEIKKIPERIEEGTRRGIRSIFKDFFTFFSTKETAPVERPVETRKSEEEELIELYNQAISGGNREHNRKLFQEKFKTIRVMLSAQSESPAKLIKFETGRLLMISGEKEYLVPDFGETIGAFARCFDFKRKALETWPEEIVEILKKPAICSEIPGKEGEWKLESLGELVVKKKFSTTGNV